MASKTISAFNVRSERIKLNARDPAPFIQRLLGNQQAMTVTGANGFTIRARTHDAQGQPYQIMGKRDRGNVRTSTSG